MAAWNDACFPIRLKLCILEQQDQPKIPRQRGRPKGSKDLNQRQRRSAGMTPEEKQAKHKENQEGKSVLSSLQRVQ